MTDFRQFATYVQIQNIIHLLHISSICYILFPPNPGILCRSVCYICMKCMKCDRFGITGNLHSNLPICYIFPQFVASLNLLHNLLHIISYICSIFKRCSRKLGGDRLFKPIMSRPPAKSWTLFGVVRYLRCQIEVGRRPKAGCYLG